ncbi:MAG TPA: TIGR03557 family F420-dependent LLM class oxidoreductase [Terriglobales bacterium]|nr:TIGR03557 family F420-dependent LLM class oxidoreductase [Terriglobales bacterium]
MPKNRKIQIGYKLSSEEFSACELVRFARAAEERGFSFALISDHFHPWTDREGQSPFAWSVLGALAHATGKLVVGTGVTCPTVRMHPAIVAQAAATVASMMPDRFFLGVGTGENLNEHILGQAWPEVSVRQEMLAEAIEVIRLLWKGGLQSHYGKHFVVENARIYSLPKQPPPIMVAAAGPKSVQLAVKLGDGLVGTSPDREMLEQYKKQSGDGKPCYGEMQVCFDRDEEQAKKIAHEVWAMSGLPGPLHQELPLPSHFEAAAKLVSPEKLAEEISCGPDPEKHLKSIREYADAGYDHICVHQIGPKQEEFMDFYAKEIFPQVL